MQNQCVPFTWYFIVAGGTFALYSLICRHAKVSLLPNQLPSDARISSFRLKVPSAELERSLKIKERLENSQTLKRLLLMLVLAGTSMVIADGVVTPAMSGFICCFFYANAYSYADRVMLINNLFHMLILHCYLYIQVFLSAVMSAVGGLKVGVTAIEQGNVISSIN